jgi:molybdopterin converting factor small subunit
MELQNATLEILDGHKTSCYEVAPGQSILAVIQAQGIFGRAALVAIVNGTTRDITYTIQPGDRVQLLPQIAGG